MPTLPKWAFLVVETTEKSWKIIDISCVVTKQSYLCRDRNMTRKEINNRLTNAQMQRDRAFRMFSEHFDDLQKRGEETFWIKLYLVKKAEVEYWKKQKADDE